MSGVECLVTLSHEWIGRHAVPSGAPCSMLSSELDGDEGASDPRKSHSRRRHRTTTHAQPAVQLCRLYGPCRRKAVRIVAYAYGTATGQPHSV
eukprot:1206331-Prymnesium_polylepis.1